MKIIYSALAFFVLAADVLFAQQARFITSGTIEYEKTVNMYALIKNDMDDDNTFGKLAFEAYQKNNPQFKKLKSTLYFADNKTLYKPLPDEQIGRKMGDELAEQVNTVYTDLNTHSNIIEKTI